MNKRFHTPEGVRDLFGPACDRKHLIEERIEYLFRLYGCRRIDTPTFEFLEVFGSDVGTAPARDLFKFFDRDGETMVLRPDFTPSVSRAVSMYYSEETMPLRLYYRGSVYSNPMSYQGRLREMTQMGVEYINDPSAEADAEMIAMAISLMKESGLKDFQMTLGNADLSGLNEEASMLFGDAAVLDRALSLGPDEMAAAALARMKRIHELLTVYGCDSFVNYDLGMVTEFKYYSGVIFQGYTYGSGEPIVRGGRYDRLLTRFGKDAPAIGFMVQTDQLLAALERNGIDVPGTDERAMLVYSPEDEEEAIRYAQEERRRGRAMACIRRAGGINEDDYREYAERCGCTSLIEYGRGGICAYTDLTNGREGEI